MSGRIADQLGLMVFCCMYLILKVNIVCYAWDVENVNFFVAFVLVP